VGVAALIAPNGFAAGPDGSIYVSNFSVFPGVNLGPVSPATLAFAPAATGYWSAFSALFGTFATTLN